MSKVSRDEYLQQLQNYIGESTADEALSLVENFTDSFDNDTEYNTLQTSFNELQISYNELKQRYRDRFFSNTETQNREDFFNNEMDTPTVENELTFENLFTTKGR